MTEEETLEQLEEASLERMSNIDFHDAETFFDYPSEKFCKINCPSDTYKIVREFREEKMSPFFKRNHSWPKKLLAQSRKIKVVSLWKTM